MTQAMSAIEALGWVREIEPPPHRAPANYWIGWFWSCPECGTLRIGHSPLLRWTAISIHRERCDGKAHTKAQRERRGRP